MDHSFEEILESDLLWADLVMVSAMHAQRKDAQSLLKQARALGRRTFVGGPWASTEPEVVLESADHVLVGEAEEAFAEIATALEQGTARRLYRIVDKPDMTNSPVPRYDLLQLGKYTSMPVQFSRGCPFQCEFCDIITIYGRKPRAKRPDQIMNELDTLRALGWRNEVFIVDDNFIGNHHKALALSLELAEWQVRHNHPFSFYTEASIDLADKTELLSAMVAANFMYVFIGIETPSSDALKESRKFQNLRRDNVGQVRVIQEAGLWVLAGFIVGFDSDGADIFQRQLDFIELTNITWAMAGVLQAPPTTALHDRMKREGRLIENSEAVTNFSPPNFETNLPVPVLLRGLSTLLSGLYEAKPYFRRALRSLEVWQPRSTQVPPSLPMLYNLRVLAGSIWGQGLRSSYRLEYWMFFCQLLRRYSRQPAKLWLGFMVMMSANHFLIYSREVAIQLERECCAIEDRERIAPRPVRVKSAAARLAARA